jgi:hypothetical protein
MTRSTHKRLGLDSRFRGNDSKVLMDCRRYDILRCETPRVGGRAFLLFPFTFRLRWPDP